MPLPNKSRNVFAAPVAKAYRPTMRDNVANLFSRALGDNYQSNELARGLFGSSGLGGGQGNLLGGLGLLDLTPIGAAFALEEAGRQIGGGQPVTGAANVALGMVPIPAVAKGGKAVVRSAARRVAGSKAAKREAVNVFEDMAAQSIPRPVQLDMSDAARLARAREQGFDTARPFYHATGNAYGDYDLSRAGSASAAFDERAAFLTDNPKVADTYLGQQWINGASDDVERITGQRRPGDVVTIYNEGSNVRPYFIAPEKFEEWEFYGGGYRPGQMKEILKDARRERAPGALMDNIRDPGFFGLGGGTPSTQAAVVDTRAMRSIFDLFEPPRTTSARKLPDGYSGEKRPRSPTRRK
jgi:hypothetical protein